MKRWVLAAWTAGASLYAGACGLNPQPLPPGEEADGSSYGTSSGGIGPVPSSSGGFGTGGAGGGATAGDATVDGSPTENLSDAMVSASGDAATSEASLTDAAQEDAPGSDAAGDGELDAVAFGDTGEQE